MQSRLYISTYEKNNTKYNSNATRFSYYIRVFINQKIYQKRLQQKQPNPRYIYTLDISKVLSYIASFGCNQTLSDKNYKNIPDRHIGTYQLGL